MTTETTAALKLSAESAKSHQHEANGKTLAIRGVFSNSASHIVSIGVTFFVTPILLTTLGAEQYGIWSIIVALTGYYGLVNMGIGKANTKYIAQFDALKDENAVRQIISTGLAICTSLAALILLIAPAVAWLFPKIIDIGDYPIHIAQWVIMLIGLKVAVILIGQVFQAGLVARKRFDLTNALLICRLIVAAVLMVIVVKSGYGLLGMALVVLAANFIGNVITCWLAIRVVGLPVPTRQCVRLEIGRMLFRFGFLNVAIQLVRRFSLFGGGIILGILVGPAAVAYFAVAESLTRKSLALGKSVNHVVMPFASQFDSQADRCALRRLLILPTRLLLALAFLLVTVLLVMGKSFLELWISPEIATTVYPIVCVLSLSLLIKMPTNGIQATLVGIGKMTFLSRVTIGEGIAMLVLGVIFTPLWGAVGMAWAVLAAQLPFSGLLVPAYACRNLKVSPFRFVANSAGPAFLSVLPALLLAVYFNHYVSVDSLLLLLLQMALVTTVAGVSAFFVCLDPELRAESLRSIFPKQIGRPRTLAQQDSDRS